MTRLRLLRISERWLRLLQHLYPPDFREEMGSAVVEAYLDRARDSRKRGRLPLVALWLGALIDSLRNGLAERLRPAASWRRAGNWGRDIELVQRRLVRTPIFTMTAIGTLTIGLGMFAVAYTAVKRVLLDPMPYKNPGDLYYVWRDYRPIAELDRGGLGGPDIVELQRPNAIIQGAAGLQPFLGGIFALREGAEPMEIAVTWTSPNLFDLLGVAPALGRSFAPDEIGPGRSQVIILTHQLWKRLGADPGIVGRDVRLQGRPFRVIGVLPADFAFVRNDAAAPPQHVDAYIPFEARLADANPQYGAYACLIRARHGASAAAVAAAVNAAGRAIDARDFHGRGLKLYAVELKADVISRIRPALIALGAAGLVLVFMLMLNLASVLLARAAQRAQEVAVSRALGANTIAIVRSTLLEGGLLGIAGGALGTLIAAWATNALVALAPLDLPRREAIAIDWRIGAVVIAAGGLLGVLAAAAPAVWAARTPLSLLLAGSAVRGSGGHGRLRRGMVVAQVALSLVLLSSAALVVRSFARLLRDDPGFRPEGVFTVRLRVPPEFIPKMSDAFEFQDRVQHALAAIPGVTGASATSVLPLTAAAPQATITFPGAPGNTGNAGRDTVTADLIAVRAHYIEVMGMRLRAGRGFTEARQNGVSEAIIDTAIVRRFFPDGNAIGAEIRLGPRPFTIIGVVDQARLYNVHADGRPQILVRSEDLGMRPLFYVMRTTREPHSLLPDVRAAVHRIDPRIPAGDARAMEDIVDASLSPQSIGSALIGAFAAGALLLAAMGLFGVVSGSVTRRRHELAVRLALGADHRRIFRLVLKEGAVLVIAGLLIGAPGIYIAKNLIRGMLAGVSPSDPVTLLAAAVGLLFVAMAACYVPARRAVRIEPAQLLRQE
ncbi:MAG TPA: ADOP family duplicated permease [Bryobacteraceae bacterium]|nr:ADOP family duplicated permease [Bryobacteraceae bacterium]